MTWRKSSQGAASSCVEIWNVPGVIAARDSADPGGPVLMFDGDAWMTFTAGLKA